MASSITWRSLPLVPGQALPSLLVSIDVGASDYNIRLTDMANIWTESLDRKAICMRAWNENASIDPSDTPENMNTFLNSLKSALDSSHPQYDQTSLTLSPGSAKDSASDDLILKATCKLPGLQPLKWPFHLKKSTPSHVATDLVYPLVQMHLAQKRQAESLIQAISNKDAVISKLLDKLEATGTGLENVFTSLSGKKKISRSAAAEKVKGLAPFNKQRWKAGADDGDDGPSDTKGLVEDVFGSEGLSCIQTVAIDSSPELDSWWHDLRQNTKISGHSQSETKKAAEETQRLPASADEEDDFQVQPTPPHLLPDSKAATANAASADDDGSTASEDDEHDLKDAGQEKLRTATEASRAQAPAPRLGTIGTIRGKTKQEEHMPPQTRKADESREKRQASETASDTASEVSNDDVAMPDKEAAQPATSASSKPTKKLGVIGRIGKPSTSNHATTKEMPLRDQDTIGAHRETRQSEATTSRGQGESTSAIEIDVKSERTRGRSPEQKRSVKDEVRETSQERADRKREELKREIERKAAAGPAKKKRRF